ncbi:hypothetical protein BDV98DRAFT_561199 [Pterulicium gracile]|uniref:MYND-type domain-containing protein n=1 Tax=Pterulicium gracile TaxID=1884261 RepID=A0A5C3QSS1_9AGAR|nr:hypothetical protein BDV98DRAFT_561199 [Pterula gracilis]
MDWDTVGFLRLSLLPSLDNIMEGMRDIFGGEHAFGPLPTHLDYEESGQNYFGLFTTICRLRDINCCENVDCRKEPSITGTRFNRCCICTVLSYCSKDCPRSSWSDSKHPHKALCKWWGPSFHSGRAQSKLLEAKRYSPL